MGGLKWFRDNQGEGVPDRFFRCIAKSSLGSFVPMDDVALLVGRNDGVIGGFCHPPEHFFAGAEGLLRPFSLPNVAEFRRFHGSLGPFHPAHHHLHRKLTAVFSPPLPPHAPPPAS